MNCEAVGANGSHDDTSLSFEASPGLNLVTGGNIFAFKDRLPSDSEGISSGDLFGGFLNFNLDSNRVVSSANIGN